MNAKELEDGIGFMIVMFIFIGILYLFSCSGSKEGIFASSPTSEPTIIEYPERLNGDNYRECYDVDSLLVRVNGVEEWIELFPEDGFSSDSYEPSHPSLLYNERKDSYKNKDG